MKAWIDGVWRECHAPAILTGAWLITLLVSVPMSVIPALNVCVPLSVGWNV